MAFALSAPLSPSPRRALAQRQPARTLLPRTRSARGLRMQTGPRSAPDFDAGWVPESDAGYIEVRLLSAGPARAGASLVTLLPAAGGRFAFRMAVTPGQADAVRAAAGRSRAARPGTHELLKDALDAQGAVVTRAAITHVRAGVFVARVWLRAPLVGEVHVDARPSDALALALRAAAPVWLNSRLLDEWRVPAASVLAETMPNPPARAVQEVVHQRTAASKLAPELVELEQLRARLALAVSLERFKEAARLRDHIARICPVDQLQERLDDALRGQRFGEAAALHDRLVLWEARLKRWEKAGPEASASFAADDVIERSGREGGGDAPPGAMEDAADS